MSLPRPGDYGQPSTSAGQATVTGLSEVTTYRRVVPSPIPPRDRRVYFVGAGLSSAFRLPNTPSLINAAVDFSKTAVGNWLAQEGLEGELERAFRFFYPDADHEGFQPDVVDFFSALRTYLDVGAGLVGTGFANAPDLYRLLRRAIAHLLVVRSRQIDVDQFRDHPYLTEMVEPGNIIITSNWDTLIEHFASLNSIPLRLTSRTRHFDPGEVSLLKLDGSLDWCQVSARASGYPDDDYGTLKELQFAPRSRRSALPTDDADVIRVRCDLSSAWQMSKSRAREPWMVTMVTGKADDLGPLREVWRDAYRALSRAKHLEIVGYSMPPDDVEIRTILRTGVQRGPQRPDIVVRNPAPDVHYRVRAYLMRSAKSEYQPVPM